MSLSVAPRSLVDWLDFAEAERRAFGTPARWCGNCRTWHVQDCSRETRRPWWERLEIELLFGEADQAGRAARAS